MARFSRGFVFSIDALLAAITMGIFITALVFLSSQTGERHAAAIQLQKQADDALSVLDKSGALSSENSTWMNETIVFLLPGSVAWSMEIQYSNYSEGGGFEQVEKIEFGSNKTASGEVQVGERSFASFGNGSEVKYGFARLKLWTSK